MICKLVLSAQRPSPACVARAGAEPILAPRLQPRGPVDPVLPCCAARAWRGSCPRLRGPLGGTRPCAHHVVLSRKTQDSTETHEIACTATPDPLVSCPATQALPTIVLFSILYKKRHRHGDRGALPKDLHVSPSPPAVLHCIPVWSSCYNLVPPPSGMIPAYARSTHTDARLLHSVQPR